MEIVNGICYASHPEQEIKVTAVQAKEHGILLVTFSTGEKRLFGKRKENSIEPARQPRVALVS